MAEHVKIPRKYSEIECILATGGIRKNMDARNIRNINKIYTFAKFSAEMFYHRNTILGQVYVNGLVVV